MYRLLVVSVFLGLFCATGMAQEFQKKIMKPIDNAINIRQQTQKQEDKWAEDRAKMIASYEKLQGENQSLSMRKNELEKQRADLQRQVGDLESQLSAVEKIRLQLEPFLHNLVRQLETLIQNDMPFLKAERNARLNLIKTLLKNQDVTIGEKYGKIMDALFLEAQYGNTIEVYREKITIEDRALLVDIFRMGRLALFCQSLDGKTSGSWNPATGKWQALPAAYQRDIHLAIEIGSKRRPVEMVNLPLGKVVTK